MLKRFFAVGSIFAVCSLAWLILTSSINSRTAASESKLTPGVASTWGVAQEQLQPKAIVATTAASPMQGLALEAERTRVLADLALEYRQKGLLWYSTYVVQFSGIYTFRNPANDPRQLTLNFYLPAQQAIYDDLTVSVNDQPLALATTKDAVAAAFTAPANQAVTFHVSYKSHGLENWRYNFGNDVSQTHDFELTVKTNFRDVEFPTNTLSPTSKVPINGGWKLNWRYHNLISGFEIGITMPQRLQPGPLAGEISAFAPLSLLLFFFVLLVLTTLRRIDLHPLHYAFLAAAFFSFHLLLAYSVDHISIQWAFAVSSIVSVGLVVSYLRVVAGERFAVAEAGLAQLVYLVLFSLSFFLPGFTGLAITIGCIATLFVTMQVTARVRWSELEAGASPSRQ